ncbi:MAG: DUF6029 family protein [Chitinophagales bacterium]
MILLSLPDLFGQGSFFGGLQMNNYFYIYDRDIIQTGIPQYENLKSSTDSWLNLNYNNNDFNLDAGLRLDLYLNSNLHNRTSAYSAQGIGTFYIRKRIPAANMEITGGYFYDQFGSGIVFRAYEDRALGIDNAILGVHVKYNPVEYLRIKAFAGVQKNRLDLHRPVIKGVNFESDFFIKKKVQLIPGASLVNRTIDQETMNVIVSEIELYPEEERFVPKYNAFAYNIYNTLNVGNFAWYVEYAGKTSEAIRDLDDQLKNRMGHVFMSSLNYSLKGFGASLQFRRTEDFQFRTSPNERLLEGMVSFMPPISRQNSVRLAARYNAAPQEISEMGTSLDITFKPFKKLIVTLNYSEIGGLNKQFIADANPYFREVYADFNFRISRKIKLDLGYQILRYDQKFYEGEAYTPDSRAVMAHTYFSELVYRINRKHSLRIELQQTFTDEDYGKWIYGLIEYNLAPWFSLSVSDMYNYAPNEGRVDKAIHYYSAFAGFTYKANVFNLAYVRQVEGIVCTGGVCRYEPAFNGVQFSINTTF